MWCILNFSHHTALTFDHFNYGCYFKCDKEKVGRRHSLLSIQFAKKLNIWHFKNFAMEHSKPCRNLHLRFYRSPLSHFSSRNEVKTSLYFLHQNLLNQVFELSSQTINIKKCLSSFHTLINCTPLTQLTIFFPR